MLTYCILESDRVATRRSILTVISLTFLWYQSTFQCDANLELWGAAGWNLVMAFIALSGGKFRAQASVRNLGPGSCTRNACVARLLIVIELR
jgi:hypothetical protein